MPKRTRIVCLHEGEKGRSIDPVFINALLKRIQPVWIRPWTGGNVVRTVDCGGRKTLIERMPEELRAALAQGADTTLMVWADVDDDVETPAALRDKFRAHARAAGISDDEFDTAVFVFAKDRIENWIEFLNTGNTDESREGPRIKHNREAAEAAKRLADRCLRQQAEPPLPRSLQWSCINWRALVARMTGG